MIKLFIKYLYLFVFMGMVYLLMELFFRSLTFWPMGIVGGLAGIGLGLINEVMPWETPLWLQGMIGTLIITGLELIAGLICNIWLHLGYWDYSHVQFNFMGQICLPFMVLWFFVGLFGIWLDDCLRYLFFNEEKPRYIML